jgi:hypothetical protein
MQLNRTGDRSKAAAAVAAAGHPQQINHVPHAIISAISLPGQQIIRIPVTVLDRQVY